MTWMDKKDGDIIYASDINMIYHRGDEVLEQTMTAKNTAEQANVNAVNAKNAAQDSADRALGAVGKTSYIGTNGNWYEWQIDKFVDTGVPATGGTGDTGATGNGIASITLISGNHAAGTTDAYRITMTSGATVDFTVYNGADGDGAGDMRRSVYDPQGKNTDIFNYVDEGLSGKATTANVNTAIQNAIGNAIAASY